MCIVLAVLVFWRHARRRQISGFQFASRSWLDALAEESAERELDPRTDVERRKWLLLGVPNPLYKPTMEESPSHD